MQVTNMSREIQAVENIWLLLSFRRSPGRRLRVTPTHTLVFNTLIRGLAFVRVLAVNLKDLTLFYLRRIVFTVKGQVL